MTTINAVPVTISTDAGSRDRAQQRLLFHRGVLSSLGVPILSDIGKLELSGSVIPQSGLTLGAPDPFAGTANFDSAGRTTGVSDGIATIALAGGTARILRITEGSAAALAPGFNLASIGTNVSALTGPLPATNAGAVIPADTAYWAASWI